MVQNGVDRQAEDYWNDTLRDELLAVAMLATIPPAEWQDFRDLAIDRIGELLTEYGIDAEPFLRGEVDRAAMAPFISLAELEVIEWKCDLLREEDARRTP